MAKKLKAPRAKQHIAEGPGSPDDADREVTVGEGKDEQQVKVQSVAEGPGEPDDDAE